jgi:hypothetical protein
MSDACIQTFSGVMFDILEPTFEMISIEDIAHAGSQANRFTGHPRYPYPVTQHEYLGSKLALPDCCTCVSPEQHAFKFLLHDGSESYTGDMNRQLKYFTPAGEEFKKIENPLQNRIYERYGLPPGKPMCIEIIDVEMLYAEKQQLFNYTPEWKHNWSDTKKAADVSIQERSFYHNKFTYLARFNELCRPEDRVEIDFRISL